MNNRYICKAKRKDNNDWVMGYLVKYNERYYIFYEYPDERYESGYYLSYKEVIPETIRQCTTLTDKNGKLIFTGDIVNALFDFGMPIKSVCGFKDGAFGLLAKQHGAEHFHAFTSICNVKYEVIGNIHDNPELLEVER